MIDREIAYEAVGALCNAKVNVVNRRDESRGPFGAKSGGARQSLILQLYRWFHTDSVETVKPRGLFGDGPGGADLFSIHQLIPRVLEADQRREGGWQVEACHCAGLLALVDPKNDVGKDETTDEIKLEIHIDDEEFFDPGYDYDFTDLKDTETFYRGDEKYERPCGYQRFALKVLGKYKDDTWLGNNCRTTESVPGEWPVSYHGTKHESIDPIIKGHYKAGAGAAYGRGIYSTPDISVAEEEIYGQTFTADKDGKKYKVILQNRINPECREKHNNDKYYLIRIPEGTSEEKEKELVKKAIRPYGLLIKEVT